MGQQTIRDMRREKTRVSRNVALFSSAMVATLKLTTAIQRALPGTTAAKTYPGFPCAVSLLVYVLST